MKIFKILHTIILFFSLFLLLSCKEGKQTLSYTETLDNLYKNNQTKELFENLTNAKESTIVENLDWLKIKILTEDSRYYYLYSRNLYRAGIKDTAAMMLIGGMLISREDSLRCADNTGVSTNLTNWEKPLIPILKDYKKMDKSKKELVISFIKTLNKYNTAKPRPPREWICKGGIKSIVKALNQKNPKIIETTGADGRLGKSYSIDSSNVKIEFISDKEWHKKSKKLREGFLKSLKSF